VVVSGACRRAESDGAPEAGGWACCRRVVADRGRRRDRRPRRSGRRPGGGLPAPAGRGGARVGRVRAQLRGAAAPPPAIATPSDAAPAAGRISHAGFRPAPFE